MDYSIKESLEKINFYLKTKQTSELSAFIIGLSMSDFEQLIRESSKSELLNWKEIANTEAVHSQLSSSQHHIANELKAIDEQLFKIQQDINEINLDFVDHKELASFTNRFNQLLLRLNLFNTTIEKMLSVTWNSNRSDLIERWSNNREYCQRIIEGIGHPTIDQKPATGLYGLLSWKLDSIYADPNVDNQPLDDNDHALEGLVRLGVFNLNDYAALGLIEAHAGDNALLLNHKLLQDAKKALEQRGLHFVKDLKRAQIYSKKALADYLRDA